MDAEFSLLSPVDPMRITSGYSEGRPNPLDGGKSVLPHKAIDFHAVLGQPVHAAAEGVVAKSYVSQRGPVSPETGRPAWYSYGERIVIDHPGGYSTTYNHLSRRGVHVGDTVSAGQEIGRTGSTGDSTGPHLHFELLQHGALIDPTPFLRQSAPPVPPIIYAGH